MLRGLIFSISEEGGGSWDYFLLIQFIFIGYIYTNS